MKPGKRTKARSLGTSWAKNALHKMGVNGCELAEEIVAAGFPNECLGAFTAALAHDDKGRFLSEEELRHPDLGRVCIACSYCHGVIEYKMPRLKMQEIVRKVAKARLARYCQSN